MIIDQSTIPEHLKPRKEETGELFKSKFMERITRSSIEVPVIMHGLIVVGFLYIAQHHYQMGLLIITLLFGAGVITWTFAEYWVHRGVYHSQANWAWLERLQHAGHGIHHQYPRDPDRLAMPPLPALLLASLFLGFFWLVIGDYGIAFFPGFLFGYMLYITLHYAQHRYKAPKFKPLNRLWKFHALHHYKYPETKAFGVSTRLWDFVFGTMPPK